MFNAYGYTFFGFRREESIILRTKAITSSIYNL
jgi:hypothetical protein